MNETDEIDWLDRQLREAAPYIDDDGFTRGVLARLPARRPRFQMVRATIIFAATLLASVVAYLLSGGGQFVNQVILRMAGMSPIMIVGIAMLVGLLMMAAGMVAAISRNYQIRA